MTLFGKIKSIDESKGFGMITPEKGGDALRFEQSALKWERTDKPKVDQRLSYEDGKNKEGHAVAVNLQVA